MLYLSIITIPHFRGRVGASLQLALAPNCKPNSCQSDSINVFFPLDKGKVQTRVAAPLPGELRINCDKWSCSLSFPEDSLLFFLGICMEWVCLLGSTKRGDWLLSFAISYQSACNSHRILVYAYSIIKHFSFFSAFVGSFFGLAEMLFLCFPNTYTPLPLCLCPLLP